METAVGPYQLTYCATPRGTDSRFTLKRTGSSTGILVCAFMRKQALDVSWSLKPWKLREK